MFVLWGKPELRDFELITDTARKLHETSGPFVLIARVPPGAEPPSEGLRKDVARHLAVVIEHCASFHGIIEGAGFSSATKRAVLAGLFLFTRHRGKLHVHAAVREVVDSAPSGTRVEVIAALKAFEPKGILRRNLDSIAPHGTSFVTIPPGG